MLGNGSWLVKGYIQSIELSRNIQMDGTGERSIVHISSRK